MWQFLKSILRLIGFGGKIGKDFSLSNLVERLWQIPTKSMKREMWM